MTHSNEPRYLDQFPDSAGHFGRFGGNHYPPEAWPALEELTRTFLAVRNAPAFQSELDEARMGLQGRPTPVHYLKNTTERIGGARLFVKREDLNHTGAHKINHCVGFALLAREMGKSKLIAETGAGQHGVALASACAHFGLDCEIYMGAVDIEKQASNVGRMRLLGASVIGAEAGQAALKEASDAAFAAYIEQRDTALYAIGSAIGPHPFPMIVREFQSVVGQEARRQLLSIVGQLPDHVVACVAGGSNAMGIFSGFLDDAQVTLHAVEPLGDSNEVGTHAATLSFGRPGTLHGAHSMVLQKVDGTTAPVRSVASGLVYPGVGPEIAMLHDLGKLAVSAVTDAEAVETFIGFSREEGIVPALESAHALAFAIRLAAERDATETILINLSGRGDKDMDYVLSKYLA